jgi:Domain of unknown function (DUF4232)
MSPSLRSLRRLASALLTICAAALVTACAAPPSSSPPSSPPSSRHAQSSSPPPTTAPPTSAPAATPPASQGPQPCPTRSLRVKPGTSGGAAGSTYLAIVFTNISSATCTLYGYPGVSLAGGSPVKQIGLAAKENPQTPRQLVTLSPGSQASALLRIVDAQNFPPRRCDLQQATYLLVYPPNQTTPVYVGYKAAACSKPVPLLTIDVGKPR